MAKTHTTAAFSSDNAAVVIRKGPPVTIYHDSVSRKGYEEFLDDGLGQFRCLRGQRG